MIGVAIVSLTLLGLSGVMIDAQLRSSRRQLAAEGVTERQRRFFRSQLRRRMPSNILIGLVGALVAIWPAVPKEQNAPWWMIGYLAMILMATLWIVAMAMLDAWATNQHYRRARLEQIAEQAQLTLELQQQKLKPKGDAAGEE